MQGLFSSRHMRISTIMEAGAEQARGMFHKS